MKDWIAFAAVAAVAGVLLLGVVVSLWQAIAANRARTDAVQAQIAHNMLTSGDWVTPRLDGVIYLEKPPLIYWLIATSFKVFGVHDWAARSGHDAAIVDQSCRAVVRRHRTRRDRRDDLRRWANGAALVRDRRCGRRRSARDPRGLRLG